MDVVLSWQVSWLAGQRLRARFDLIKSDRRSNCFFAHPENRFTRFRMRSDPPSRNASFQWHDGSRLAAYSCGGSTGFVFNAPVSLLAFI